jgi:hypothetical protein
MRLLLIAALCLPVSAAHAQASLHWQMWHAIRKAAPQTTGKPPAEIPDRARDGGQR